MFSPSITLNKSFASNPSGSRGEGRIASGILVSNFLSSLAILFVLCPFGHAKAVASSYVSYAKESVITVYSIQYRQFPKGVRISVFLKMFRPTIYSALLNILDTDAGYELFSLFISAKQNLKYYGICREGWFSHRVIIRFKVGSSLSFDRNVSCSQGFTYIKVGGVNIASVAALNRIFDSNTRVRCRVYINPVKLFPDNNLGDFTEVAAHEVSLHLAPALDAVKSIIFNNDFTPAQKSDSISERQNSFDPDISLNAQVQEMAVDEVFGRQSSWYRKFSEQSFDQLKEENDRTSSWRLQMEEKFGWAITL